MATTVDNPDAREFDGNVLPLTYGPADSSKRSAEELKHWIRTNRSRLVQQTNKHGAILFRGFDVTSAHQFADCLSGFGLQNMPYIGGAAVRTNVVDDLVFTANESPASEPIPFHHEMAQVPKPPSHVLFFCETAPESGGSTPLISSRAVCEYFSAKHPEYFAKVKEMGVKYIRVLPATDDPSSPIGRSWKSTFLAETQAEAEANMEKLGTTWEWLPNGDLRTETKVIAAIQTDGVTGKDTFFNSMVAAFLGWRDSRNDPTRAIVLSDGTPVDFSIMEDIAAFMDREKVSVPWQAGDFIIVDNNVTMHSREPFSGPRRVLASIARGIAPTEASTGPEAAAAMPTLKLRTGARMPVLGLGIWKISRETCADAVVEAIKAGYRHFDAACDYGNEIEAGQGIKRAIDEGLVTREELWITSKLWNTYHHPDHVEAALQKTLDDLQLSYVDLYLIHFPISLKYVPIEERYPPEWIYDTEAAEPRMEMDDIPIADTWGAMEVLYTSGKAKNIGVCNFNVALLRELMSKAVIKPAVLQVELHPYLTQEKLLRFCKENGIAVTGFSPLGAGSYVSLGMATDTDSVLAQPLVSEIAGRYGKSPAQVVLRWAVQRGTSVVAKTTKPERLIENRSIFDFRLSHEEMVQISSLNMNRRFNDPGVFCELAFKCFCPIYE